MENSYEDYNVEEYISRMKEYEDYGKEKIREFKRLIDEMKERCSKTENVEIDSPKRDYYGVIKTILRFRYGYEIDIRDDRDYIQRLLAINFEKFCFLESYIGIYSSELGVVEILFEPLVPMRENLFHLKLFKDIADKNIEKFSRDLDIKEMSNDINAIMTYPSTEFRVLNKNIDIKYKRLFTLRFEGFESLKHNSVEDLVEELANLIFFQINLSFNFPLNLVHRYRSNKPNPKAIFKDLEFKDIKYDKEPMKLYWFAKNSWDMPIFQYLAYYRVIEYYFPKFSRKKDKEEERLYQVLKECINVDDIKEFIQKNKVREKFFKSTEKISQVNFNMGQNDKFDNLRKHISKRIYDIRCRIAHSKSNENPLIPYSTEIKSFKYDIDLVELIAEKVIQFNAQKLNL